MTPQDIAKRVLAVAASAADDETAHGMEDKLHHDVLLAIAEGKCEDPAGCAATALETLPLDFDRWCG